MKRSILVTGGNRGIGQAIVKALAQSSEDEIFLGCRDVVEGESVAKGIGTNVTPIKIDLTSRLTLAKDLVALRQKSAHIDVLINNAGILCEGDINQCSAADVEASLRINALGPMDLIREFLPTMEKNGYGRIVNVSSGWGSFDEGLGGPFAYSISKATLNALTLSVAKGLRGNVKVNSMCPGWVRTRMGGLMASRSPEEGADTAVWLANLPDDGPNGGFFRDRRRIEW